MYPSERKAKELGIKQVNVLEETRKFFYDNFPQEKLRARFDKIYNYYKAIEGKNFNDSDFYKEDHKLTYPACAEKNFLIMDINYGEYSDAMTAAVN